MLQQFKRQYQRWLQKTKRPFLPISFILKRVHIWQKKSPPGLWTRIPNVDYRSKWFKGCTQAIINDPVERKGLYAALPCSGNFLSLGPMKGSSTCLTKHMNGLLTCRPLLLYVIRQRPVRCKGAKSHSYNFLEGKLWKMNWGLKQLFFQRFQLVAESFL